MKNVILVISLIISLAGRSQTKILDTIGNSGKNISFKVQLLFDAPDRYSLTLKNLSGRSIYFVPSDYDITSNNKDYTGLAIGQEKQSYSDIFYYQIEEIKSGEIKILDIPSQLKVNEVTITLVTRKIEVINHKLFIKRGCYDRAKKVFKYKVP
jgi:hypothetical protein